MKRGIKPEELRLWSMVAATVHPLPGRVTPRASEVALSAPPPSAPRPTLSPPLPAARPRSATMAPPPRPPSAPLSKPIEPRRNHRIARERDPISAHIDLHGLGQDQARAALERFVLEAWNDGFRSILVITGKGLRGDGVLRRMTPEWLAAPRLRDAVAGISEAHRHHGGEGALYVALKRRVRP